MSKKEIIYRLKRDYPEILAAQRKNQLKKVLKVLLIDALLLTVGYFSKSDFERRGFEVPFVISVAIICIFVAFWCKPRFAIIAPIRHGKIVKYDIITIQGAKDTKILTTLSDAEKKHNMLKIIVENGKGGSFVLTLPPQYSKTMRLGDEILKLPGLKYPIVITEGSPKHLCPICGNIAPAAESECIGCGASFVNLKNKI